MVGWGGARDAGKLSALGKTQVTEMIETGGATLSKTLFAKYTVLKTLRTRRATLTQFVRESPLCFFLCHVSRNYCLTQVLFQTIKIGLCNAILSSRISI